MLTVSRAWQRTVKAKAPKTLPVHVVADRWRSRIDSRFRSAMLEWQTHADVTVIEQAIRENDAHAIEAHLDLNSTLRRLQTLTNGLAQCYQQAGQVAAHELGEQLGLPVAREAAAKVRFDIKNPRAVKWANDKGAELVTAVSDSVKQIIREAIAAGLQDGIAPAETARLIRGFIGLTARQAMAVVRYRLELVEAGRASADVLRLADRYSRQLLNQRAMLIARTETIAAASSGQQEVWRQNADAGLLDRATTRRKWIVTHDDRLDLAICGPMDGQKVELEEPFTGGDGSMVDCPPIHPGCRCATGLVFL